MRRCAIVVLILLLVALPAHESAAQWRGGFACGNGECEKPHEDCAYCPQDCGVCPRCGDGKCTGNETCLRCPKDCNECPKEEENLCGNAVCDGTEDCGNCSKDCGDCQDPDSGTLSRWIGLLQRGGVIARRTLRQIRRAITKQYAVWEQSAEDRSVAARQLHAYLDSNPRIAGYFTGVDRRLIERVGQSARPTPLNLIPAFRMTYTLKRAARKEEKNVALSAQVMLQYPSVREELEDLPNFTDLKAAAEAGDIGTAAALMPRAQRPLRELTAELENLQQIFGGAPSKGQALSLLIGSVFAQQESQPKSGKEAFAEAVLLLQKMRERAEDPGAALPSLEEHLSFLKARSAVLAGIVNLPEEEVQGRLNTVQNQAGSSSPKTLINLVGLMDFVRSSPNFRAVEESASDASSRMLSGVKKVISIVTQQKEIGGDAEAILTEEWKRTDLDHLLGNDLDAQKNVLRTFFRQEDTELKEALSLLPEESRDEFLRNLAEWESDFFEKAESVTDLRKAVLMRSILMENVQGETVRRRHPLVRLVYRLQTFFGVRS